MAGHLVSRPHRVPARLNRRAGARWRSSSWRWRFSSLFLFVPLVVVFVEALEQRLEAYVGADRVARRACGRLADAARRGICVCRRTLLFGIAAAGQSRDSTFAASAADDIDRPAVRGVAGDCRHGLRAALRTSGLVWRLAVEPRHQGHLCRARHRAGDNLRVVPVRSPRDHRR